MTTVDDIIADVKVKAAGRTRYDGQRPYGDELLVAEIERLREESLNLRECLEYAWENWLGE